MNHTQADACDPCPARYYCVNKAYPDPCPLGHYCPPSRGFDYESCPIGKF